jgi:hypothetical protein
MTAIAASVAAIIPRSAPVVGAFMREGSDTLAGSAVPLAVLGAYKDEGMKIIPETTYIDVVVLAMDLVSFAENVCVPVARALVTAS